MIKKLTIILLGLFIVFLYTESLVYAQEARGGGIDYLASIKKAKKEFSIPLKFNYHREIGGSSIASTGFTVAGSGNAGAGQGNESNDVYYRGDGTPEGGGGSGEPEVEPRGEIPEGIEPGDGDVIPGGNEGLPEDPDDPDENEPAA